MAIAFDEAYFRRILGHYPTGVCAITSVDANGNPVGMIVGSFISVSLLPRLVAFLPARASASWAKLRECDGFCVNVLADEQEQLCRTLSSKDPNKFDTVEFELSENGMPILVGALAWIDCARYALYEAGDHDIVLGEVLGLGLHAEGQPLLFHKGIYTKVGGLL